VQNIRGNGSRRRIETIVVSDGSTDRTAALALAEGAIVIEQARRGKIAALHEAALLASGEVLVLTDANTRFEPGAIDALADPLSDPTSGITAGDLVYENPEASAASEGESTYWRWETAMKRNASTAGLLLMGAGGIYAVRRDDWPFDLPSDLADDSYVPLALHLAGRVNLFVESARGRERAGMKMSEEWRRRVRMVAQDARVAMALGFCRSNPRTFFAFVSHKLLRWLLAPLGLIALLTLRSATNRTSAPIRLFLRAGGQGTVALIAAGGVATALGRRLPLASTLFYLASASVAACLGLGLGLAGQSRAVWEKAASTRHQEGAR
jgi:glycosyltransferase involved in cell wall biosynthesis